MIVAKFKQVKMDRFGYSPILEIDTELHVFGDSSGVKMVEMRQYDRTGRHDNWQLIRCSALTGVFGEKIENATPRA